MNTPTSAGSAGVAEWKTLAKTRRTTPIGPSLLGEGLYETMPIRHGAQYQRQANYHGWYAVASTGKHVWCESLLERSVAMLLDFAGDILAIASQPVRLEHDDRVHTPDFLVLHRDGTQTLIDVKPSDRLSAKVMEQFDATATICERVGWGYRVMTELDEQQQVNLEFLGGFRRREYLPSSEVVDELIAAFDDSWTFADLVASIPARDTAHARAWALGLLWSRIFSFDLGSRLENATPLTRPTLQGIEAVDALR